MVNFRETSRNLRELDNQVNKLIDELASRQSRIELSNKELKNLKEAKQEDLSEDQKKELDEKISNKQKEINDTESSLKTINQQIDEKIKEIDNMVTSSEDAIAMYELGTEKNEPWRETFSESLKKEAKTKDKLTQLKKSLQERKKNASTAKQNIKSKGSYQKKEKGFWSFIWDAITAPFKAIVNALDFVFGTKGNNKEAVDKTQGYTTSGDESGIFSKTGGKTYTYSQSKNNSSVNSKRSAFASENQNSEDKEKSNNEMDEKNDSDPDSNIQYKDYLRGKAETIPLGEVKNKGHGRSHFNYVDPNHPDARNPGWHITTQVKGFGKKEGLEEALSIHDFVDEIEFNEHNKENEPNDDENKTTNNENSWMNSWIDYSYPPEPNAYAEYEHQMAQGNFEAAYDAYDRSMAANREAHAQEEDSMSEVDSAIEDLRSNNAINDKEADFDKSETNENNTGNGSETDRGSFDSTSKSESSSTEGFATGEQSESNIDTDTETDNEGSDVNADSEGDTDSNSSDNDSSTDSDTGNSDAESDTDTDGDSDTDAGDADTGGDTDAGGDSDSDSGDSDSNSIL